MITPETCRFVEVILNTANPNKIVFKGTKEFNIEATALSISVSAMAKKKAGIKEPKRPERRSHFHFDLGIVLSLLKPKVKRIRPVIIVLSAPN
ncbi:hypothetical protein GCM10022292_10800 [Winogradskyella damuponensis]|uniref:Uncharacterized protein n=1 Tax=Winogradskyella damuponensis TaxID=943939 RepID=A0ABP8CQK8_9FLAO